MGVQTIYEFLQAISSTIVKALIPICGQLWLNYLKSYAPGP